MIYDYGWTVDSITVRPKQSINPINQEIKGKDQENKGKDEKWGYVFNSLLRV